jgi:hypothetical protein
MKEIEDAFEKVSFDFLIYWLVFMHLL